MRLRQPVTCHISACCVGCRVRITDHPQGAGETGDIRLGFDSRVRLAGAVGGCGGCGWRVRLAGAAGMPWLEDRFRRWPVAVPGVGRDPGIARYCRRSSRKSAKRPQPSAFRGRSFAAQPVFGLSAGYDDVSDADRPALDPVMRQVVGGRGVDAEAASAGRMGRFETGVSAAADNRGAPADVSGQWIDRGIDRAHAAMAPEWITPETWTVRSARPMARRPMALREAPPGTGISAACAVPCSSLTGLAASNAVHCASAMFTALMAGKMCSSRCWRDMRIVS